jgi:hypothetical protein
MLTDPRVVTASSVVATPSDVSEILTLVYGEYPQVYGKSEVDCATSALSASYQQRGAYPNSANMEDEKIGDTPTSDPSSPDPVPEPSALFLVGIGLAGLSIALRLRQ